MNEIDSVFSRLRGEEDLAEICATIAAWARVKRLEDLVIFAKLIASGPRGSREETVLHEIEEQVALLPDEESVDAVATFLSVRGTHEREGRARALASRLGAAQAKPTLLAAIDRHADDPAMRELLACWLHEAVLRGAALASEPRATKLQSVLAAQRHALAELPLALLEVERDATTYLPMYGESALTRAVERLERGSVSARTMPPPTEHKETRATPIVDPDLESRMRVAIEPWLSSPKGRAETSVFRVTPNIPQTALAKWLLRVVELECAPPAVRLLANRSTADAVFGMLFSAAANGGASSSGFGGAHGRRAAFTSMGALLGASPSASPVEIDRIARGASYLTFLAPEGGWFHDVAWDLGALVLRPDGDSVAVIAASDAV